MTTNVWNDRSDIQAEGSDSEKFDDFCYLDNCLSYNGNCEKDVALEKQQQYSEGLNRETQSDSFIHSSVQC